MVLKIMMSGNRIIESKGNDMRNLLMYAHNGSANHGCEALVRSTVEVFKEHPFDKIILMSHNVSEDEKYGLGNLVELHTDKEPVRRTAFSFLKSYYKLKVCKDPYAMDKFSYCGAMKAAGKNAISLSIGGDNFCYEELYKFIAYHQYSKELGQKTVLWGCSVDEIVFENTQAVNDFCQYDLVVARETLTFELMKKNGVKNLILAPDPAFFLPMNKKILKMPKPNTIGINLSPLVLSYAQNSELVFENCIYLVNKILKTTDYNISLIPHVVWCNSNDLDVLKQLAEMFKGEERVSIIEDMDAPSLKSYISHLDFLVTARTHASIAAYSTGVPTLVLGYSIKSRGIAFDLFGSIDNYVISVQEITDQKYLWEKFEWLLAHESEIKSKLAEGTDIRTDQMERAVERVCNL